MWIVIGSIVVAIAVVVAVAVVSFQIGRGSNSRKFVPGVMTYGGSGSDSFRAVAIAPDGHYIVAGYTDSESGSIVGGRGGVDALVAQISPDGTLLGYQTFGGSGEDRFTGVAIGADGGIVAVGFTDSTDGDFPVTRGVDGDRDAVIVKLAADGSLLWVRAFGGSDYDYFDSVAVAADGSIVAVGRSFSPDGDFPGTGEEHGVVVKLSGGGDLLWAKSYGGSEMDFLASVAIAANGSIAVAGASRSPDLYLQTPQSTGDAFVALLSSSGEIVWAQKHGGEYSYFASVLFSGKNVIAAGAVGSLEAEYDASLVKLSSKGEILWVRTYGGSDAEAFKSVALCKDGGLVAAGFTVSDDGQLPASAGDLDGVVVKVSSDGTLAWAQSFGDLGRDEFFSVAVTASGGIVAVGTTLERVGVEQGASTNAVLARYSAKGSLD